MHNRAWAATGTAVALLGLAGALSGCSSAAGQALSDGNQPVMRAASSSLDPPSASAGGTARGGPDVPVVELASSFSPSSLRLGVGQQFELIVAGSVEASGLSVAGCASGQPVPLPGGLLSVQCKPGTGYVYSVERAGTATLAPTVRPRCPTGVMCPMWVAGPTLTVTISG